MKMPLLILLVLHKFYQQQNKQSDTMKRGDLDLFLVYFMISYPTSLQLLNHLMLTEYI